MKLLLVLLLALTALGPRVQALTVPTARGTARAEAPVVRTAAGGGPTAIETAVEDFRADLGGADNGVGGSFGAGWREISWDEAPDSVAAPNLLPADYFNTAAPLGIVLATPGSGFALSANDGVAPVHFGDLTLSYADLFTVFSPQRLLTPLGSAVTDVQFYLPGTATAASVSGFAAIFSNVRLPRAASIECFDLNGASLGTWYADPDGGNGLSFLGVSWSDGTRIARVRISSGTAPLAAGVADSGATNLVALDDFIYGEPQPDQ